ncbi:MAG TPA: 4Fe-4S binding protein [Terriglobales bacterium]|nr:4Fe-4S binding protein [Terriglobales bacterium]
MATAAIVLVCVVFVLLALVAGVWLVGERGHLLLPSTARSLPGGARRSRGEGETPSRQPAGRRRYLDPLEGYVYGRWTNQYIRVLMHKIVPRLSDQGRQRLADKYHGKVLTHEQAKAIVQLDTPIRRDLEQIIPYPMARDFILNASPEIAAYECACRHARENPCSPTQVCMVMGNSVQFILEHNPHNSRRLTQEEALELLKAEHERGHVHSAWFKDVIGNRFYALCNCCKCCCGGIEMMTKYGVGMVASSGYVAVIESELCNACGLCEQVCPFDALKVNGCATLVWAKCMGCGVCVDQCMTGAISLGRDEDKGVPLDVRELVN